MSNVYIDMLLKEAASKKNRRNRIPPTLNGTPTPGVVYPPNAGPVKPTTLLEDVINSPWAKGAVDKVKEVAGEHSATIEKQVKDKLNQRIKENVEPHIDQLLDKVLPVAKKTVEETAAKPGMPTWAKVGLGTVGGLGLGLGAYKGYVGMNKEAALSNLLEQGYTVEHAVGLMKQAEAASYEDLLRAQSANERAQYRGSAESVLGAGITGAAGAGLGYTLGKTPTQKAKFVGIGTSLGAIPGSVLGYLHGSSASRENSLNQMDKEAALSNLLEQGYSVEHALAALRHTG